MTKVKVILENAPNCQLDSETLEFEDGAEGVSEAIKDAIFGWELSPGDTIKIIEL